MAGLLNAAIITSKSLKKVWDKAGMASLENNGGVFWHHAIKRGCEAPSSDFIRLSKLMP